MTDYLIFQLAGIMASWGNIACGEQRPTLRHPTKSAIIGLIGAALGIDRDDAERQRQLTNSFNMGVAVYRSQHYLRDYHTTQVAAQTDISKLKKQGKYRTRRDELSPDDLKTILSDREYWQDVYFRIALTLSGASHWKLSDLQSALITPQFHLYLGRKSCPVCLPLSPVIVTGDTVCHAFDAAADRIPPAVPPTCAFLPENYINIPERIVIDRKLHDESIPNVEVQVRRDVPYDRKRWEFSEREEITILQRREF
jgi:CRISPR system Cascade subunit CasD